MAKGMGRGSEAVPHFRKNLGFFSAPMLYFVQICNDVVFLKVIDIHEHVTLKSEYVQYNGKGCDCKCSVRAHTLKATRVDHAFKSKVDLL